MSLPFIPRPPKAVRFVLPPPPNGLHAIEFPHGYADNDGPIPYGVSSTLKRWFPPFDTTAHSHRIYNGIHRLRDLMTRDQWSSYDSRQWDKWAKYHEATSAADIESGWKVIGDLASDLGSAYHNWIEQFYLREDKSILQGRRKHEPRFLTTQDDVAPPPAFQPHDPLLYETGCRMLHEHHPAAAPLRQFLSWHAYMADVNKWVWVTSERPVSWKNHAGRFDALYTRLRGPLPREFCLVDFKFGKLSCYEGPRRAKSFFSMCPDTKFAKYAAQLNYYAVLLFQQDGIDVGKNMIIFLPNFTILLQI